MRPAILLVLCACSGRPAPRTLANRTAPEVCDAGAWRAQATSRLRVRLHDRDLIVVDSGHGVTRVVTLLRGAIVTTTVDNRTLDRVVTRETPLWDAPGGPPLPGIFAEPGVAATGTGAWRHVAATIAIMANGYVPVEATGLSWTAAPLRLDGKKLGRYGRVHTEPRADAMEIADIAPSEPAYDQIDVGPGGWLHVTASDPAVRVTGWVEPPPPPSPPGPLRHTYDFSSDTIEGDLVRPEGEDGGTGDVHRRPLATGCIRAHPEDGAEVIGVVTGDLEGVAVDGGWLRVELATEWGPVTGYAQYDAKAE